MINYLEGPLELRGSWRKVRGEKGVSAVLSCKECGEFISLRDYRITDTGVVEPYVKCPKCTLGGESKLIGWRP